MIHDDCLRSISLTILTELDLCNNVGNSEYLPTIFMESDRIVGAASSIEERILNLAKSQSTIRTRDAISGGIHPEDLRRLVERGVLLKAGRGMYTYIDAELSEHHSLAVASQRVEHGVICLLSALQFHGIGTQAPFEVWMAIDVHARRPNSDVLSLRPVYMSGLALTVGIETHAIEGTPVRIFNPAKTIVDCFKYRHKIGLDVALEALRESWESRRCSMDELWEYAKVCRMSKVMRPYLEYLS
jgi:predicted transcriptional regulator of viral defense system